MKTQFTFIDTQTGILFTKQGFYPLRFVVDMIGLKGLTDTYGLRLEDIRPSFFPNYVAPKQLTDGASLHI